MAKKLAITISCAVSLGSYEAGVAFEILDAVAQHSQWADASNQPDERFAGGPADGRVGRRHVGCDHRAAAALRRPLVNPTLRQSVVQGLGLGCGHRGIARAERG